MKQIIGRFVMKAAMYLAILGIIVGTMGSVNAAWVDDFESYVGGGALVAPWGTTVGWSYVYTPSDAAFLDSNAVTLGSGTWGIGYAANPVIEEVVVTASMCLASPWNNYQHARVQLVGNKDGDGTVAEMRLIGDGSGSGNTLALEVWGSTPEGATNVALSAGVWYDVRLTVVTGVSLTGEYKVAGTDDWTLVNTFYNTRVSPAYVRVGAMRGGFIDNVKVTSSDYAAGYAAGELAHAGDYVAGYAAGELAHAGDYAAGYTAGHAAGYAAGYADGELAHAGDYAAGYAAGELAHAGDYAAGYTAGELAHAGDYAAGYAAGELAHAGDYAAGYTAGHAAGYSTGFSDGWNALLAKLPPGIRNAINNAVGFGREGFTGFAQ